MLPLRNILQNHESSSPFLRGAKLALMIERANVLIRELWGEAGERYARALYIKNHVLNIACLSSAMSQEIILRSPELIQRLNNEALGGVKISKIRCLS